MRPEPTLSRAFPLPVCIALAAGLTGCAASAIETAGSLSAYDGMKTEDGLRTKSRYRVEKDDVLAAKTVTIVPTKFSGPASRAELTDQQRHVIANAIDRSICIGLSDRFEIVVLGQPADLSVHATVTHVTVTNPHIAGASQVASVVPSFLNVDVPVPRIPFGMGSLSTEGEARDPKGVQKAAMLWARGADAFTSSPRISRAGDAYDLASAFGDDFSELLLRGDDPFETKLSLPAMHRIKSSLGGRPKNAACDAFGRTGITDKLAGQIGAPPEWHDKGAATQTSEGNVQPASIPTSQGKSSGTRKPRERQVR